MEWVLILVVVVIGYFIYSKFRYRCPDCGLHSRHKKNTEAEKQQIDYLENLKEYDLSDTIDDLMTSIGSSYNSPDDISAIYKCKACNYSFSKKESEIWLTIANEVGERNAITEFRKCRK